MMQSVKRPNSVAPAVLTSDAMQTARSSPTNLPPLKESPEGKSPKVADELLDAAESNEPLDAAESDEPLDAAESDEPLDAESDEPLDALSKTADESDKKLAESAIVASVKQPSKSQKKSIRVSAKLESDINGFWVTGVLDPRTKEMGRWDGWCTVLLIYTAYVS